MLLDLALNCMKLHETIVESDFPFMVLISFEVN